MALTLPRQLGIASTWVLTDYASVSRRSAPAAGGVCDIAFDQLEPGERWLIDHAVIWSDSTTPTILRLYEGQVSPLAMLDGSASGNFDVADWPAGLAIAPSMALLAHWTGASDGSHAVVTLQARILRR